MSVKGYEEWVCDMCGIRQPGASKELMKHLETTGHIANEHACRIRVAKDAVNNLRSYERRHGLPTRGPK
jgi:hypothetical protein